MGKTELARSYFKSPFEHRDRISWAGYDEDKHDCIIFDDVPSIYAYINNNRALFQAGDFAVVQTSATNVYAMTIDVSQKPIIVTTNDNPYGTWILANSVPVEISETTYLKDESHITCEEVSADEIWECPIAYCKRQNMICHQRCQYCQNKRPFNCWVDLGGGPS